MLARVDAARRGQAPSAYDDDDVIFFPTAADELPAGAPRRVQGGRRFLVSLPAAIGYALAATLAGFLIRGALPTTKPTQLVNEARRDSAAPVSPAVKTVTATTAIRESQEVPVAVQFVLDARRAGSVAVVGDFNSWNASANPMVRDSASGAWTALVDVKPGRHVYAFLVDGKEWTLDPRAQRTKDADYGTEQSVMIVGLR